MKLSLEAQGNKQIMDICTTNCNEHKQNDQFYEVLLHVFSGRSNKKLLSMLWGISYTQTPENQSRHGIRNSVKSIQRGYYPSSFMFKHNALKLSK